MSDSNLTAPAPDASHSSTDRRTFLTGMGLAACASLAAADQPATALAAAAQTNAPRKRGPAPSSGTPGIKELLARKEPVAWVFTGDSITHGALHTRGWRSYPEHFAERVRWELKRMRDIVINTGVSGDRTQGLLADLDWRVLHLKPGVVSVMLGMNDSSYGPVGREIFRKELTAITTKIMATGAIPILNTPNTVYAKNAPTQADLAAYAQIVRDVALGTRAVLVDHFAHWEKTKPDQESLLKWLEDQSIHPGVYGHRELARLIFRELGVFDEDSPTCQLEVP
jgi:lysophospholipase L1-like esterase